MARFQLTQDEKTIVDAMLKRFERHRKARGDVGALLSEEEYYQVFPWKERQIAERFLEIDPVEYGVTMPRIGDQREPTRLIPIRNQRYVDAEDGKEHVMGPRYLPPDAHRAFNRIREAMHEDVALNLLIYSGYRTPRHQLLTLVATYQERGYRLSRALRYVAMPDRTQHTDPVHTAMDFMTETGVDDYRFAQTDEYAWLQENAKRFDFEESYPKGNKLGVAYEPWHWRYMG